MMYLANEPSVGLFYIQQQAQNSVPKLVNLKNNLEGKSRELTLHTEDSEDSITMVRSMKECGALIADEMIKDINNSLAILSTNQPEKGPSKFGRTSSWDPASWGRTAVSVQAFGERSSSSSTTYFTAALKSAKERASNLKWPQFDSQNITKLPFEFASSSSVVPSSELQEFPSACQIDEDELVPLSKSFDEFRANKYAKLEEWLGL